jgi:hypothetical protein
MESQKASLGESTDKFARLTERLNYNKSQQNTLTEKLKTAKEPEQSRILKEIELNNKEFDNIIDQANSENKAVNGIAQKILEEIRKRGKGGDSLVLFDLNDFVMNLVSPDKLGALSILFFSQVMLACLISIIFVFYGDLLIKRFDLENKYPKIAKFIQLRRKFQQYYLLLNIF